MLSNTDAKRLYQEFLYTVKIVGIDETFKTVPTHPPNRPKMFIDISSRIKKCCK